MRHLYYQKFDKNQSFKDLWTKQYCNLISKR